MKTIQDKVIKIIHSIKDNKTAVTPDMSLADDLYLDSLDMLMLINALEANFSVKVDMEKIETVKTVGDIVQMLHEGTQK
jgi:acyl carrier protein